MDRSKPQHESALGSRVGPTRADPRRALLTLLERHASARPERTQVVQLFVDFVADHPDCAERSLAIGHLTGSAWVVAADGARALLLHHAKLDRWLQPGGHADGSLDLAAVALREATEEGGLAGLVVEPAVFDLDRHWIPPRGAEPGHWHYDLRFVVRTTSSELPVGNAESRVLAWRPIAGIASDPALDESVQRLARYWLERGAPA